MFHHQRVKIQFYIDQQSVAMLMSASDSFKYLLCTIWWLPYRYYVHLLTTPYTRKCLVNMLLWFLQMVDRCHPQSILNNQRWRIINFNELLCFSLNIMFYQIPGIYSLEVLVLVSSKDIASNVVIVLDWRKLLYMISFRIFSICTIWE